MFVACQSLKRPQHVPARFGFALDEDRFVADRLLLLVDRADLRVHHLGADLHVADRVIAVRLGIALPDRDRVRHQLAHRRLVVVVADDATRDARRTGADACLVEHDDPRAVHADGRPPRLQSLREVHRRGQAMDTRADDDVMGVIGKGSHWANPRSQQRFEQRRQRATRAGEAMQPTVRCAPHAPHPALVRRTRSICAAIRRRRAGSRDCRARAPARKPASDRRQASPAHAPSVPRESGAKSLRLRSVSSAAAAAPLAGRLAWEGSPLARLSRRRPAPLRRGMADCIAPPR